MSKSRPPVIAALAAFLLTAPLTASAAPADDAALLHMTTLNLQATGEVKTAPDQASISFGVQTQAPTAADAMRQNRARMASSLAALKALGIESKDVQTSSLNLEAQYASGSNQVSRLTGYQAVNLVTVTVHDLSKLGPVIDAVIAAGGNQVNGAAFGLTDLKTAEDEARRRAIKSLASRAELYAEAAGMKVGRLINLSEGGAQAPAFRVRAVQYEANVAHLSAPTPMEPGSLTISVEVSATYELIR